MKKRTIIYLILLLTFKIIAAKASPQESSPEADHVAIYVKDLARSEEFYRDVMQLKKISEPFHDDKHVWFNTGKRTQLHVIEGAKHVETHDINNHVGYSVPNLEIFRKHLDAMHIKYQSMDGTKPMQTRPDGVKQLYFKDPDNYWIEVNEIKS